MEGGQIGDIRVAYYINITTHTAVATIGPTLRLIFSTAEAETPIASFTCLKTDFYLIVKHDLFSA